MTRAERAAKNEALFREVKERVKDVAAAHETEWTAMLCECSDPVCMEKIDVTLDEYEAVRARGDRFVLRAGHQDPSIERVVDANDRFLVVEKLGEGADVARDLDPRSYELHDCLSAWHGGASPALGAVRALGGFRRGASGGHHRRGPAPGAVFRRVPDGNSVRVDARRGYVLRAAK